MGSITSRCPGDNEFRHNIVKVVCRSPRLSPRDSTATFDNVMSKFMINNKTDARETDVSLLNVINWYSTGDENGHACGHACRHASLCALALLGMAWDLNQNGCGCCLCGMYQQN